MSLTGEYLHGQIDYGTLNAQAEYDDRECEEEENEDFSEEETEMTEELDFIQPKKIVGEMIPLSVIEDIKAELIHIYNCHAEYEWSYSAAIYDAIKIIEKHMTDFSKDSVKQIGVSE